MPTLAGAAGVALWWYRRRRAWDWRDRLPGLVIVSCLLTSYGGWAFDLVVLDPPRTGTTPRIIEAIARFAPRRVVYVSCDPATFARDVRTFGERGIRLDQVRVFDLYPETAHVELIATLR